MPQVTFKLSSGVEKVVTASSGTSLMEAAKSAGLAEIIAECGGSLSCATCHVYVDSTWLERVPPARPEENDMLEVVPEPRPGSRLSCQILLSDALDGLLVEVPESQI
jgi:ferredoxin, 2Fe-2S